MISHLHGVLRSRNEEEMSLEIEVGGVAYEVFLPMFAWRARSTGVYRAFGTGGYAPV